jgi:DNA-binding NarL/FixJ family response regulator
MRIVLADDHALFRDGVSSLLQAWGHEVVGLAASGREAVDLVARLEPDLVLMDVRMPGMSGVQATQAIAAVRPETPIVMLTVSEDEEDLFAAIRAGARGYLLKDLEASQLRAMIEAVARGEAAITPATAARIIRHLSSLGAAADESAPDRLTGRELEVLRLVTAGRRNKEIATELGITENTAKYHLRNILEKLHAESRTQVATRALREGLVDPE